MKKLIFILLINTAGVVHAQDMRPFFSAVVVSNIDSSIAWYKNVFRLQLRNRTDAPERGFIQANLHNKEMLIELIQVDSSLSKERILKDHAPKTRVRGFMKFGFTVKNIDALYKQLKDQNIKFTGRMVTDPVDNKKTFLINDPDDNLIQFFEQ